MPDKITASRQRPTLHRQVQQPSTISAAPELVLIRGLPGSGKSTLARKLAAGGYAHFEADMFFERDGKYCYDASKVRAAHAWCQNMVRDTIAKGRSVVVSNTFTRLTEIEPYRAMGATVHIIEATGNWPNVHGVAPETLERMAQRWETLQAEPHLRG